MNVYPNCIYTVLVYIALLLNLHIHRKDKPFLALFTDRRWRVFFTEYLIFSAPLLGICSFTRYPYLSVIYLAAILLVSLITYTPKGTKNWLNFSPMLPSYAFEWISGVRRFGYMLAILYLAALLLTPYPVVSFVLLWLGVAIVSEFYREGEPLQLLCLPEKPFNHFIWGKIRMCLISFIVIVIPVAVAYIFFNPDSWWLPVGFLLFSAINLVFIILTKYTYYQPNHKILEGSVITALAGISILFPLLLPLPLIFSIRNYYLSEKNLNIYLDAYNQ